MDETNAPQASKTAAALVILSEELSVGELEDLIGLAPDRSWERGDQIGNSGRARQPFAGWRIDSEANKQTPEYQIAVLLDRVRPIRDRVGGVAGDPRVHSVALWVWSAGQAAGIDLTPNLLMDISRLGATLKIDVYDVEPREEGLRRERSAREQT